MRKSLASLLIICILYQCAGYLLVFQANFMLCRKEMKKAIKAGLSDEQLEHFSFTEQEYKNLDWQHEHEFKLHGVLYDIVRSEFIDGKLYLSCVNDKQESRLFAHLSEHINNFSDIQKEGKASTKLLLKLLKIHAIPLDLNTSIQTTFKAIEYITLPILNTINWVFSSFQPPELKN